SRAAPPRAPAPRPHAASPHSPTCAFSRRPASLALRYSGLKIAVGWASSSPDMSSVRQKPSPRNGANRRAWTSTGTSRAKRGCGIHSMSGATRACTPLHASVRAVAEPLCRGDRPRGLARLEAHDAVELSLNQRRFERLKSPLRPHEQRAKSGLHPFVQLRHAAQLVIERRDVFASPFRNVNAIAPKKKVVVQVALRNASDCVQITSLQGSLKCGDHSRRLDCSLSNVCAG